MGLGNGGNGWPGGIGIPRGEVIPFVEAIWIIGTGYGYWYGKASVPNSWA